ncbi:MAG: exodeoxyribonuclease VII large subunit [Ghiorsea sp.]|nr:exodeoxyribonuclease VII large subunit [Ghiorsea sp.]
MANTPLTVTELTARIKQVLEQGFSRVEVTGEISRLTSPSSGHLYFTIKDSHAAISAVVWRSAAARLKTRPKEGQAYVFTGHLSLYEPRGSYQLVVTGIASAGAGRLAEEFERRKVLFAERGWFDADNKKGIPTYPKHIAIVTSQTAAAFADVKKVLSTRPAWLNITLSPAVVQGESAPQSITRAMQRLHDLADKPDVILLVRGGGSMEDLWCFNDERVVQAIVDADIPIISGVGHEIDTTLADLAADVRAATPSNATRSGSKASARTQSPIAPVEKVKNCCRTSSSAPLIGCTR